MMRSGSATDSAAGGSALAGYQRLTVEQVLADLPSLGLDELLLVDALEQAGEGRIEILHRIDELLARPAMPVAATVPPQHVEDDDGNYDDDDGYEDVDDSEYQAAQPAGPPLGGPPLGMLPGIRSADKAPAAPVAAVGRVARAARVAPVPETPGASLSQDLFNQMDALLERGAPATTQVAATASEVVADPPPPDVTSPRRRRRLGRKAGPTAAPPSETAPVATTLPPPPLPDVISPRRGRRRRSFRPVKVLVGLVLVAAVSAGGLMYVHKMDATSTGSPGRAGAAASTAGLPLASRLVASIPGYAIQPTSPGGTGPTDLAQAVRNDTGGDAAGFLAKGGFVGGHQRVWTNTPQRQVTMFLYQFDDVAGAAAYARHWIGSDRAANRAATEFTDPGIPGAFGLHSDGAGRVQAIEMFTRDRYLVRVVVVLPAHAGETALAQQLSARQLGLL